MSWWSHGDARPYQVVARKVSLSVSPLSDGPSPDLPAGVQPAAAQSAGVQPTAATLRGPAAPVGPEIKSFVIRRATLNDCAPIAQLELASAQFERRLTPITFTLDELRTLWRKRISSGDFHVLVAEGQVAGAAQLGPRRASAARTGAPLVQGAGGASGYCTYDGSGQLTPLSTQLLGFVGLQAPRGQEAFIQAIYVAPPFYRRGLGAALLTAGEKIMRQRGCPRVKLYVEPFNRMGHNFYHKLGFYRTNQKHRHLNILVKELSSC